MRRGRILGESLHHGGDVRDTQSCAQIERRTCIINSAAAVAASGNIAEIACAVHGIDFWAQKPKSRLASVSTRLINHSAKACPGRRTPARASNEKYVTV